MEYLANTTYTVTATHGKVVAQVAVQVAAQVAEAVVAQERLRQLSSSQPTNTVS